MRIQLQCVGKSIPENTNLTCIYTEILEDGRISGSKVKQFEADKDGIIEMPNITRFLICDTDVCETFYNSFETHGWVKIDPDLDDHVVTCFPVDVEALKERNKEKEKDYENPSSNSQGNTL